MEHSRRLVGPSVLNYLTATMTPPWSPGIKRDKIMRNTKPACESKRQILCKTSPIERFYTNPVGRAKSNLLLDDCNQKSSKNTSFV